MDEVSGAKDDLLGLDDSGGLLGSASDGLANLDDAVRDVLSNETVVTLTSIVLASNPATAWAVPLVQGASVAAQGGDIRDVLEASAKAYVAQQIGAEVGASAEAAAIDAGFSATAGAVLGSATGASAGAVVVGGDPKQAFITGGITAAIPRIMNQSDTLRDIGQRMQREDSSAGRGIDNPPSATERAMFNVIKGTTTAALTGQDVDDALIASVVKSADLTANVIKDSGMLDDLNEGQAALVTDVVNNVARSALTGGDMTDAVMQSVTRAGARALQDVLDRGVRNTIDNVSGAYQDVYDKARELEATDTALQAAQTEYNRVYDEYEAERDVILTKETAANTARDRANRGEITNAEANEIIKDYNDSLAAFGTRVNDYFNNELATKGEAYQTLVNTAETQTEEYNTLRDELVSKADQIDSALNPIYSATNEFFVNTMDPDFNEVQYRELNNLSDDVDAYEHWLDEGQFEGLKTNDNSFNAEIDNIAGALTIEALNQVSDVTKYSSEDIADLKGKITNDLKTKTLDEIRSSDAGNYVNIARDNYTASDSVASRPSLGDDVTAEDIVNGGARLVVGDNGLLDWRKVTLFGTPQWSAEHGQLVYHRPTPSGQTIITDISGVNILERLPLTLEIVIGDTLAETQTSNPNAFIETATNIIDTSSNAVKNQLRNVLGEEGYDYVANTLLAAKNSVANSDGVKLAAATALRAGGGITEAMNDMLVLAGINPETSPAGQAAYQIISLGESLNTEEYKQKIQDFQTKFANAEGVMGKAEAILGGFQDAPVEMIAEFIGVEFAQEAAPWLVGGVAAGVTRTANLAKGVAKEAAEAAARRAGLQAAAVSDVGESAGSNAGGAYDEALQVALANGMSETEANDYAYKMAVSAGILGGTTTILSLNIGGQALEKALLNKNTSGPLGDALDVIGTKLRDGATITLKEGVTEGLEEGVVTAFKEGSFYELDPTRDVSGNIAGASMLGFIAGGGTSGSIYGLSTTGDMTSNALMVLNGDVGNIISSSQNSQAGANTAKQQLTDLGITDSQIQSNLLNQVYDAGYTDKNEAVQSFNTYEYYTPTDAEVSSFVGNTSDANRASAIEQYIDPRYVDRNEILAAAEAEGITLTEEQINSYIGQKDEESTISSARNEFDPLATTYEEAKQFFNDLGYTPTYDEITSYVGGAESDQQAAIDTYVDPLYTDFAEAKSFLEEQGYTPSDEEVQQFVGQIRESQQETATAEYADPRVVSEDEVVAAYEALGLTRPTDDDVQELVGQYMEEELGGRAEEYLPTARYNSIISIVEELGGGDVSPEMQEALDIVKKDVTDALGDLGLEVAAIDQTTQDLEDAVGKIASGEEEASGLYAYIDTAVQDLKDAGLTNEEVEATVTDIVGSPATDDAAATGLYAEFETLGTDVADIQELLGAPATEDAEGNAVSATGLYGYIDTAVESLGTDISNLAGTVGTPAVYDENGVLVDEATGVFAEIDSLMAQGLSNEEAIAQVADDLGVAVTDLTTTIGEVETGLSAEIGGVSADVGALAGVIGRPGITDDPSTTDVDESRDPTGLFGTIAQYEAAGQERDQATQNAISDLATSLGTTEQNILTQLGLTETEIIEVINKTEADILGELGDVETQLGEQISGVEETLGADIEAVADLVGKPAGLLTDTDIDFVADLIAQQQVLEDPTTYEFTDQDLRYDVTGDAAVTQEDLDLLKQLQQDPSLATELDLTLDPTLYTDPTGVYKTVLDTQTELESQIGDTKTALEAKIAEESLKQERLGNYRDFRRMFMEAGDIGGQRVDVKTPDPLQLGYLYDFSSIFANPRQESLFASPYARGGKVDINDELLQLLGDK